MREEVRDVAGNRHGREWAQEAVKPANVGAIECRRIDLAERVEDLRSKYLHHGTILQFAQEDRRRNVLFLRRF